jgi:hypothetical protein
MLNVALFHKEESATDFGYFLNVRLIFLLIQGLAQRSRSKGGVIAS